MIVLAGLVHLPIGWIMGIAVVMVVGHRLLDSIHFAAADGRFIPWTLLHDVPRRLVLSKHTNALVLYPIIPWVGVMAVGYGFGRGCLLDPAERQKWLLRLGFGLAAGFVILRLLNVYGDPAPWSVQKTPLFTFMSFVNCTKYPPSLLYLLMTLGPALLVLGALGGVSSLDPDRRLPLFALPLVRGPQTAESQPLVKLPVITLRS
jgi:uncharacterized membrane protein